MSRILIADDFPVVRRGLRDIISRDFRDAVFGEAADAQEVLSEVQRAAWDLVILDVSMPGRSGLDVLKDLRMIRPQLPILIFSMHDEAQLGKRALRSGASGYISKASAPEELVKAIGKVLGGGKYVSASLGEKLAFDFDGDRPAYETLSPRQFEVLRMLALGKTVTEIAEDLHLSVPTVNTHRMHTLKKVGVRTTAELVRYAWQYRLVE